MVTEEEHTKLDRVRGGEKLALVVAAGGQLWSQQLPAGGRMAVGRSEGGVVIEHPHVSRHHCSLLMVGPVIVVEDCGSANGTWVREQRLAPGERARIEPGDLVRLGKSVCFWLEATGADEPVRQPPAMVGDEPLVVACEAMRTLFATVDRIAQGELNVLIVGETGAGKAVVARAIHERSPRANGPFYSLDCAGLSEAALERELLGDERPGLLERARGGTILLDEVGELPPACQAKLLRPLEERQVQRLGATIATPIDVRFLAATNRDLESEVSEGRFRADLFFRLDGFTLEVPPLRERRDEVLPLARTWARFFAARMGRPAPLIGPAAEALLTGHTWPGNVRELRSAIDRAVLLCGEGPIEPAHLRLERRQIQPRLRAEPRVPDPADTSFDLERPEEPDEAARIKRALEECGGNQSRAAKLLGVSRKTLIRRLDRYGLPRPRGPREGEAAEAEPGE